MILSSFRNARWLFIASIAMLPAGPAWAWLNKEVRDWTVTCTNGLTCTMQGGDYENEGLTTLSFERTAEPDAPVAIIVSFNELPSAGDDISIVFTIDGANLLTLPEEGQDVVKADNSFRFEAVGAARTLLDAMMTGSRMTMRYESRSNRSDLDVSLSGVTAGLLYVDEVQDRLQRVDALQAVGDRPAPAMAAVGPIGSIEELPPSIRGDFETDEAICGGNDDERFGYLDAFQIRLDEDVRIVGVPCGLGGAYNQPYVFYTGMGDRLRPLSLPTMTDAGPSTVSMAYNVSYEPQTGRITAFFKARGIGDCGGYDVYTFAQEFDGVAFTLIESRAKGDCDGDYGGGPEAWPLVWPKS